MLAGHWTRCQEERKMMMPISGSNKSLGEKMGDWLRHVLSCCDQDDEEEDRRPALQIVCFRFMPLLSGVDEKGEEGAQA